MRVRQSDWAAQCPYSGIQDFPELLARLSESGIEISDVNGLQSALDALAGNGGGTVSWSNISGKPTFGSAAYAPVTDFTPAPTDRTFQRGQIDFVASQRSYAVIFDTEMRDTPDIDTQFYIGDGTSEEMFYGSIQDADETGFTLWLNTEPTVSSGWCIWRAEA